MAEKFREHLDKVQETIQEALDALPNPNIPDESTDNKLLIPMLTNVPANGLQTNQVKMVLTSKESSAPNSGVRDTASLVPSGGSAAEAERSSFIFESDNLMCKIIDEDIMSQINDDDIHDDKVQLNPS